MNDTLSNQRTTPSELDPCSNEYHPEGVTFTVPSGEQDTTAIIADLSGDIMSGAVESEEVNELDQSSAVEDRNHSEGCSDGASSWEDENSEEDRSQNLDEDHEVELEDDTHDTEDTILHRAVERHDVPFMTEVLAAEVCSYLLEARNEDGLTPLHLAVQLKSHECVTLLLANGADPTLEDEEGYNCLTSAVQVGSNEMLSILLDTLQSRFQAGDAVLIECLNSASRYATLYDEGDMLDALLSAGASVDSQGNGTLLHFAAFRAGAAVINTILDRGLQVNTVDKNGTTALHIAASEGNVRAVKCLLDAGADPNLIDPKYNANALGPALSGKKAAAEAVRILIDAGANTKVKVMNGRGLLHIAAQKEWPDVMELLIEQGLDPNEKDEHDGNAATWAAINGNSETLKVLHRYGCDVLAADGKGNTPLTYAITNDRMEAAMYLISIYLSRDDHPRSALSSYLMMAIAKRQTTVVEFIAREASQREPSGKLSLTVPMTELVKASGWDSIDVLVQYGASLASLEKDYHGKLVLRAAQEGSWRTIESYCSTFADRNIKDPGSLLTPVHMAALKGHPKAFDVLVANGFSSDRASEYGQTPLHLAAKEGHHQIVKRLVKSGDLLNADRNGYLPLHWAAVNGQTEIIRLLLQHGPETVDAQSLEGRTALHYACLEGDSATVNVLLEHKANINCRDGMHNTPIHQACLAGQRGGPVVATLLKQENAMIDARNRAGDTPLSYAASSGCLEAVEAILKESTSIDMSAENTTGWSPLLHAARNGRSAILKRLLEASRRQAGSNMPVARLWLMGAQSGQADVLNAITESGLALDQLKPSEYIPVLVEALTASEESKASFVLARLLSKLPGLGREVILHLHGLAMQSHFRSSSKMLLKFLDTAT